MKKTRLISFVLLLAMCLSVLASCNTPSDTTAESDTTVADTTSEGDTTVSETSTEGDTTVSETSTEGDTTISETSTEDKTTVDDETTNEDETKQIPEYLRMEVMAQEPSMQARLRYNATTTGDALVGIIGSYFAENDISFGEDMPNKSAYDHYAKAGDTIFVCIWLQNPDQCTILSMTINGVKYQIGGALRSYFYADGTNCVFAEISIPANAVTTENYEVTEIQYIEASNQISGNGKQVLLGGKDTSVSVGILYEDELTASVNSPEFDANSFAAEIVISDNRIISLTGALFRAVLMSDGGVYEIKPLKKGVHSISFDDIPENKEYTLAIVAYYDTLDGKGLTPFVLATHTFTTEKRMVLTGSADYKSYNNGMGAMITLGGSFEAIDNATRIELLNKDGQVVYTVSDADISTFNDTKALIISTDQLLNNHDYTARVTYGEKNRVENIMIHTPSLTAPYFADSNHITIDGVQISILDGYGTVYYDNGYEEFSFAEYVPYGTYYSTYHDNIEAKDKCLLDSYFTISSQVAEKALIFTPISGKLIDMSIVLIDNDHESPTYGSVLKRYDNINEGIFYIDTVDDLRLCNSLYLGKDNVEHGFKTVTARRYYSLLRQMDIIFPEHSGYKLEYRYMVDLNDGQGAREVSSDYVFIDSDPYDYSGPLYDINSQLSSAGKYTISTNGKNEAYLTYNAVSYPKELYLLGNGYVQMNNGEWVDLSPEIYKYEYGGTIDGDWGYEIHSWPDKSVAEMNVDKNDATFSMFRFQYYNDYSGNMSNGGGNLGGGIRDVQRAVVRPGGAFYMGEFALSKEPVFAFTKDEIAELDKYIYNLEEDWIEGYLAEIKEAAENGGSIEGIPTPEFTKTSEKTIVIDTSKFPTGMFTLAADSGYIEYTSHPEISPDVFPGEWGEVWYCAEAVLNLYGEEIESPSNIRFEGTKLVWDAVDLATDYIVRVSYTTEDGRDIVEEFSVVAQNGELATSFDLQAAISNIAADSEILVELKATSRKEFKEYMNDELYLIVYAYPNGESDYCAPKRYEKVKIQSAAIEYISKYSYFSASGESVCLELSITDERILGNAEFMYAQGGEFVAGNVIDSIKYGDTVSFYLKSNSAFYSDSDKIELTYAAKIPAASLDEYNSVVLVHDHLSVLGIPFDEDIVSSDAVPFSYSMQYRIDGGEIIDGDPNGIYVRKGSTIEIRYIVGYKAYHDYFIKSNETFEGEWCSITAVKDVPDFLYTTDGAYATLTGYRGESAEVVIPQTLDGYTVIAIGAGAFSGTQHITSVTIPASVTSIDATAFDRCDRIKTYTVDAGNTVYASDSGIIYNVGFTEIKFIPLDLSGNIVVKDGVVSIAEGAFADRKNLTGITFPDSVSTVGLAALRGCTSLTYLSTPTFPKKYGANAGGDALFGNGYSSGQSNNVRTLVIRCGIGQYDNYYSSFTNLEKLVFSGTSIASATVYLDPFKNLNIKELYFESAVGALSSNAIGEFRAVVDMRSVPQNMFSGRNVTSVEFTDKVVVVNSGAFSGCKVLRSVKLGGGTKMIGANAFENCISLMEIDLLNVEKIGENAFVGCTDLIKIKVGSTLSEIGAGAFSGCTSLYEIYDLSALTFTAGSTDNGEIAKYAKNIFTDATAQSKMYRTDDGFVFYDGVLIRYTDGDTATLPESYNGEMYTLSSDLFNTLKNVTIPSSWTEIPDNFFKYMPVVSVDPSNVRHIGAQAFYGSNISSIDLSGVETIGESAFESCSFMKNATVDLSSLTSLGKNAFSDGGINSSSLAGAAIISDKLTSMGANAFGKGNISTIYYVGDEVSLTDTIKEYAGVTAGVTTVYYYSESDPFASGEIYDGNFWHYDASGNIVHWVF